MGEEVEHSVPPGLAPAPVIQPGHPHCQSMAMVDISDISDIEYVSDTDMEDEDSDKENVPCVAPNPAISASPSSPEISALPPTSYRCRRHSM